MHLQLRVALLLSTHENPSLDCLTLPSAAGYRILLALAQHYFELLMRSML